MGEVIQSSADDGHQLSAYCALPEGNPRAAVVVIQEIFGVTGHIRQVADSYASAGYAAIAPALFDRVQSGVELDYSDMLGGKSLVGQIDPAASVCDVTAAVTWASGYGKVAVVGYCWGGTLAYLAAANLPIAAAVAYYGGGIAGLLGKVPEVPVMYHFGADDMFITSEHVSAIRSAVDASELHIYEGAGHGFNCNERPDYRPKAAALARERTLSFLAKHLG